MTCFALPAAAPAAAPVWPWLAFPLLFLLISLVVLAIVWGVFQVLLAKSGLHRLPTDYPSGAPLSRSHYGSARLNGIHWNRALQLTQYADGYALRPRRLFGAVGLWISAADIAAGRYVAGRRAGVESLHLHAGGHDVVLDARLTDFVRQTRATDGL